MKWLTLTWYQYLFTGCTGLRNLYCRATGHREPVWFTNYGDEPDMHCSGCGEDLG